MNELDTIAPLALICASLVLAMMFTGTSFY